RTVMWALPEAFGAGVKLRVPVADGLLYVTTGSAISAGLLDVAVTVSAWPLSSAGPAVMPARSTVWVGASSGMAKLTSGSTHGASLTGSTRMVNCRAALVFTFGAVPLPSSTRTTLTVAVPLLLGAVTNDRVPPTV